MTGFSDEVRRILPANTVAAWPHVATVAPNDAVLMGGTALAVHLQHRVSRDLDLFTSEEFDPDEIESRLANRGTFAATLKGEGTLNGVFDTTNVQFLWAKDQRVLEAPQKIAGMRIGSISDLIATKLAAVRGRGELRDDFDLMVIEQRTGRRVEEGLQLVMERYGLSPADDTFDGIIRALGYFDDVETDPSLVTDVGADVFDIVSSYWTRRQPAIAASLDSINPTAFRVPMDDPRVAAALDERAGSSKLETLIAAGRVVPAPNPAPYDPRPVRLGVTVSDLIER